MVTFAENAAAIRASRKARSTIRGPLNIGCRNRKRREKASGFRKALADEENDQTFWSVNAQNEYFFDVGGAAWAGYNDEFTPAGGVGDLRRNFRPCGW
jgi:hypothetical protein